MTTFILVAAMIPLALGAGPGAGARASLAKLIIGGQLLSLVLSLLVTPVTYSLLDSLGYYLRGGRERRMPPATDADADPLPLRSADETFTPYSR